MSGQIINNRKEENIVLYWFILNKSLVEKRFVV